MLKAAKALLTGKKPTKAPTSGEGSKPKHWVLGLIDIAIKVLVRAITWGVIFAIGAIDLLAMGVTLVVAFQDHLPPAIVDFVNEYIFQGQKHGRLSLAMIDLGAIADLMRSGLKALGVLWIVMVVVMFGATFLSRYAWKRRTRKAAEAGGASAAALAPGEILVPLHDPLMLQMDDDFSRFVHVYAFYLDLRCRSADDASAIARTMENLKAALSAELVKMAEGRVVQVKRDDAMSALSDAARAVTNGGIVGVILRTSDYHRLRKPESAIKKAPEGAEIKPKLKMSTSWGAKPYQDIAAGNAAAAQASAPAAEAAAAPAQQAAPVEETPPPPPVDAASLVADKARDVLAGLRG